jgi:hypothetical protein
MLLPPDDDEYANGDYSDDDDDYDHSYYFHCFPAATLDNFRFQVKRTLQLWIQLSIPLESKVAAFETKGIERCYYRFNFRFAWNRELLLSIPSELKVVSFDSK